MGGVKILQGNALVRLKELGENSVDAIVTDPPYELGFMGKAWDNTGIANSVELWRLCLRVLKPGGHLLSFGGSRTYHRMACAIEDAGFEIRDQIMWVYGSGFPKSLDVGKAIDKAAGAEREVVSKGNPIKRMIPGADQNSTGSWIKDNGREFVPTVTTPSTELAKQWDGWGTALKPAHEPICVARKPIEGTVSKNMLRWGTGAINVDRCRIGNGEDKIGGGCTGVSKFHEGGITVRNPVNFSVGRWPANLIHDGSDEVLAVFPDSNGQQGDVRGDEPSSKTQDIYGEFNGRVHSLARNDSGSAARFFYCAKASRNERNVGLDDPGAQFKHGDTLRKIENAEKTGNTHPTVKPQALMRYLCRLVTPPGGVILDPFAGSGSTGIAALHEGFGFIGIEISEPYIAIAKSRILAEVLS